jgi:hypothetical protein
VSGGIFLVQGDRLVEMNEEGYASEELLQQLLARYPSILAGDMATTPRRWLLISPEVALASEEDRAGRWSVDHLFVDQDAVPTIVEVKRSSDTRIRREVVGQMLDYAANAVVYWPPEALRATFEAGDGAEERLRDFLDPESDADVFWEQVGTNLKAGRIRLVFVSDEIPPELRRIVEFLNTQMTPADVLAVEIKQYVGEGLQTLVPRVIGQTAEAQMRKRRPEGRHWDEASFLEEIERHKGSEEAAVARQIIEWSRSHLPRFTWGKGASLGTFSPALDYQGHSYWPFAILTNKGVEIQFQWMNGMPPFDQEAKRLEFVRRLNDVPGVQIPEDAINRRPSLPLGLFVRPEALATLLAAFEWFLSEARRSVA